MADVERLEMALARCRRRPQSHRQLASALSNLATAYIAAGRVDEAVALIGEAISTEPDSAQVINRFSLLMAVAPGNEVVLTCLRNIVDNTRPNELTADRAAIRCAELFAADRVSQGRHLDAIRTFHQLAPRTGTSRPEIATESMRFRRIRPAVGGVMNGVALRADFDGDLLGQIVATCSEGSSLLDAALLHGTVSICGRLHFLASASGNDARIRGLTRALGRTLTDRHAVFARLIPRASLRLQPLGTSTNVGLYSTFVSATATQIAEDGSWTEAVDYLQDVVASAARVPDEQGQRTAFLDTLTSEIVRLYESADEVTRSDGAAPLFDLALRTMGLCAVNSDRPHGVPSVRRVAHLILDEAGTDDSRLREMVSAFDGALHSDAELERARLRDATFAMMGQAPADASPLGVRVLRRWVGEEVSASDQVALWRAWERQTRTLPETLGQTVVRSTPRLSAAEQIERDTAGLELTIAERMAKIELRSAKGHHNVERKERLVLARQLRMAGSTKRALEIEVEVFTLSVSKAFFNLLRNNDFTAEIATLGEELLQRGVPVNRLLAPLVEEVEVRKFRDYATVQLDRYIDELRALALLDGTEFKELATAPAHPDDMFSVANLPPTGPELCKAARQMRSRDLIDHQSFVYLVRTVANATELMAWSTLLEVKRGRDDVLGGRFDPVNLLAGNDPIAASDIALAINAVVPGHLDRQEDVTSRIVDRLTTLSLEARSDVSQERAAGWIVDFVRVAQGNAEVRNVLQNLSGSPVGRRLEAMTREFVWTPDADADAFVRKWVAVTEEQFPPLASGDYIQAIVAGYDRGVAAKVTESVERLTELIPALTPSGMDQAGPTLFE